jgi:hypothetical protein
MDLPVPHRKNITSPLRAQQVNAIYRFVTMVYYEFWTLSIVLSFIYNSTQPYKFVRTSQETHYVSATSPTGQCYL